MPPTPLQSQIHAIRQQEYISLADCALLFSVSIPTLRRRLAVIPRTIRIGRNIRIHRPSALVYFQGQALSDLSDSET